MRVVREGRKVSLHSTRTGLVIKLTGSGDMIQDETPNDRLKNRLECAEGTTSNGSATG